MLEICVVVDKEIKNNLNEKDQQQLVEHIATYAEHGLIEPSADGKIYLDYDLLRIVHEGIVAVQDAAEEYGFDDNGFVKYPWPDVQ